LQKLQESFASNKGRRRKTEKEARKRSKSFFSVTHDSRGEVEHIWYRFTCFE
jgi:hypothetical protein